MRKYILKEARHFAAVQVGFGLEQLKELWRMIGGNCVTVYFDSSSGRPYVYVIVNGHNVTAYEGYWVVRDADGRLRVYTDGDFQNTFKQVEDEQDNPESVQRPSKPV